MSQNRSVLITGCGIVSAIGQNCGQVLDSLLQVRTGVGPLKYLKTEHTEFPVGEVKLSDEEMERLMGIAPGTPTTRTALMGMIALHEALGNAGLKADDLKECGFVNGTTVGGMDKSEQYYLNFIENDSRMNDDFQVFVTLVSREDAADTEWLAGQLQLMINNLNK